MMDREQRHVRDAIEHEILDGGISGAQHRH